MTLEMKTKMDELAETYAKRKEQDGNVAGKKVSLGEFIKGKV